MFKVLFQTFQSVQTINIRVAIISTIDCPQMPCIYIKYQKCCKKGPMKRKKLKTANKIEQNENNLKHNETFHCTYIDIHIIS